MGNMAIAIDGPASSGKSTVAKILANQFGYIYIDTGAMYRSITYLALKYHVSLNDEKGLVQLIETYPITFEYAKDGQRIYVDGEEVTKKIREQEVTKNVSEVSAHAKVREALVTQQQQFANNDDVVMDGRDIGTVVLPNAKVKIFLVASVKERAQRRYLENQSRGIDTDFETLLKEIEQRDYLDSNREASPLKQAEDAIRVDTTGQSIDEVVLTIQSIIKNKLDK